MIEVIGGCTVCKMTLTGCVCKYAKKDEPTALQLAKIALKKHLENLSIEDKDRLRLEFDNIKTEKELDIITEAKYMVRDFESAGWYEYNGEMLYSNLHPKQHAITCCNYLMKEDIPLERVVHYRDVIIQIKNIKD